MKSSLAVGVDLGGTTLTGVAVDRTCAIWAKRSISTNASRGVDAVINDMVSLVESLSVEDSVGRSELVGVGVGSPGPLSHRTGRIIRSANLPGWVEVPLRERLSGALQNPVILENDGHAAAFGEFRVGAGRDVSHLVMLTLGTGVGAGVIIDGRILHGHFENAAEVGHWIVEIDGLPCPCGQRGCLEQYTSADAVVRRVITAVQAGEQSALSDEVAAGRLIAADRVVECAKAGDALCLRIWDEACQALAVACINIQHAFNPALIVLGGGMSLAGDFLLDRVTEHVTRNQWSLHNDLPAIVPAQLGDEAGAIGAAGLVWQQADRAQTRGSENHQGNY